MRSASSRAANVEPPSERVRLRRKRERGSYDREVIEAILDEGLIAHLGIADEQGQPYAATADDAAYAIFQLKDGTPLQFNSSWCVRVRRDDLLTLHVDGTHGSAVAGLRRCRVQHHSVTPRPIWNPDIDQAIDFYAGWEEVPTNLPYDNAFKAQWELFLKHVVKDAPFRWSLLEGAKGVQLAELGVQSWQQRRWLDVPPLA